MTRVLLLLALLLSVPVAVATMISTTSSATLGGLSFGSGDVVDYDADAGTAALVFDDADLFDAAENVDAWTSYGAGWLLSTSTDGSAGAFTFLDGDVIRFAGGSFSVWFSEAEFGGSDEDIDALHLVEAAAAPAPASWVLMLLGLDFLCQNGYSFTGLRTKMRQYLCWITPKNCGER